MKPIYLCITPFFPSPDRWQGAYVLDQVKAIKKNSDFEVIVFKTSALNKKEEDYTIDGIKVHCIRPMLMPSYILNGLTERLVGRMFVCTLRKYAICVENIAYVHCHTINHSAFGFGVRNVNPSAKVIVQFHDLDPFTLRNGKWSNVLWNKRYRAKKSVSAINRSDLLLCISEPVKDVLLSFPNPREKEVYEPALSIYQGIEDLYPIKTKKIYVLNNGVDTSLFVPIPKNTQGIFRIGCIANFQDLKDHCSLIEAFKMLIDAGYSNVRLSLLGSGETKKDIVNYIKNNNLEDYIEWPDEVQHQFLPQYYNTLDLFVLPSRFEGFGCVYTEAYACGIPFICTEYQGAAECIVPEERNLWLVKDKNPRHLFSLIERQYKERNVQHLCKDIDIDILILDYLKTLKAL